VNKNVPFPISIALHQIGGIRLEDDKATISAKMWAYAVFVTLGVDTGYADPGRDASLAVGEHVIGDGGEWSGQTAIFKMSVLYLNWNALPELPCPQ
jgi:hypothetical protein